jgi:hypothetical protein
VIIVAGLMLQLKKNWTYVQPVEMRGTVGVPAVTFDQLLAIAQSVPEANVRTWEDIPRIEGRPQKGLIKLVSTNNHEIQIDLGTGKLLAAAHRRSDIIEAIHDGSFFHDRIKLFVFFPAAIVLLGLWMTGFYLFLLPFISRSKRRHRLAEQGTAGRGQGAV